VGGTAISLGNFSSYFPVLIYDYIISFDIAIESNLFASGIVRNQSMIIGHLKAVRYEKSEP
jgi:hypothetical protein